MELLRLQNLRSFAAGKDARVENVRANGQRFVNIIGEEEAVIANLVQRQPKNDAKPTTEGQQASGSASQQLLATSELKAYVRAGPRAYNFFDPKETTAAIVTCGGLCPGLNNIILHITKTLLEIYGAKKVLGIRGGFDGFYNQDRPPIELSISTVSGIQDTGGSFLGSSRGGFDLERISEAILAWEVDIVFICGGDGTHRAAMKLAENFRKRSLPVAVAGIPKTIDNDLGMIDRSFGFQTAVAEAVKAIKSAKTEASCAPNGVGIVKLMGRHSGFIAAHATLSSGDVDLVLIPELMVDVEEGSETNVIDHVLQVVKNKGHAVVVVAEGAAEELLLSRQSHETDANGKQPKLPPVGIWFRDEVKKSGKERNMSLTVKYIDPSYMIRSVKANSSDSLYALMIAQNAVYGAMAGYTAFSTALCNNKVCYLPIKELVDSSPRGINPRGRTMERVFNVTQQPPAKPQVLRKE
eukprot:g2996.t1